MRGVARLRLGLVQAPPGGFIGAVPKDLLLCDGTTSACSSINTIIGSSNSSSSFRFPLGAAVAAATTTGWRSYGAAASAAAVARATSREAAGPEEHPSLNIAITLASIPRPAAGPPTAAEHSSDSPATATSTGTSAAIATATATAAVAPPLSFSDHRAVFEGQSTWQLLRAYAVLRACGFKPLVTHAETLLGTSRRLLGVRLTEAVVKASFFGHFCAGEDVTEVQRTVDRLRAAGVGAILDYAAEDDVGANTAGGATDKTAAAVATPAVAATAAATAAPHGGVGSEAAAIAAAAAAAQPQEPSARALGVVGRTYDYASEEQCDLHVEHFLAAIEMAAKQPGRPAFAAIKMTALGNPALLQRASSAVSMLHGLFQRFDEDGSGYVDRGEFERQWRRLVGGKGGSSSSNSSGGGGGSISGSSSCVVNDPRGIQQQAEDTFRWLDKQGTGKVDYVSWCQHLDLRHMPLLAARIHEGGGGGEGSCGGREVADICLDEREVELMAALLGRLQTLVSAAMRLDVRLMIDAEHTYFQPAIEHVTLKLMREHNRGAARVLNTYQAYLLDSRGRLRRDLERARREGWVLGAKLVRGAYLHLERRRAEQLAYPSPVWGSLAETHACYDACAEELVAAAAEGRAEMLLGTHNQASVEFAVTAMAARGMVPPAISASLSSAPTSPAHPTSASPAASSATPSPSSPASASSSSDQHSESPVSDRVMFGQLLGMSDHLTLTLGKAGYRAYKYVPYGKVGQVMPYLLRRAAENQDIMKGAKQDLTMLRSELRRRAAATMAGFGFGPGLTQ